MEIEVPIPPALGGGDFVMRELTGGEYEDGLKRAARGAKGDAGEALLDLQSEQVMLSLVKWHGKPVPSAGAAREEWWRSRTARQIAFLKGIFDKLHFVPEKEIADFFEEATKPKTAAQ